MNRLLMRLKLIPLTTLFALFLGVVGCGQTTLPKESGTSTTVGLPGERPASPHESSRRPNATGIVPG